MSGSLSRAWGVCRVLDVEVNDRPERAVMRALTLTTETKLPTKGGDETTLVQPEGVPTVNRAVVSRDAGMSVGRASGALLTGPTLREEGNLPACEGEQLPRPTDRYPRLPATPAGALTTPLLSTAENGAESTNGQTFGGNLAPEISEPGDASTPPARGPHLTRRCKQ